MTLGLGGKVERLILVNGDTVSGYGMTVKEGDYLY